MGRSLESHITVRPIRRRWRRYLVRALIVLGILCGLIAVAAVWLAKSLPTIVAQEIGRITNTRVEAGAFGFRFNGSLSVDGLTIRPSEANPAYDDTILRAKSVFVRFDRRSLLALRPRVTDLRIEDFMVDAQFNLDTGRWNVGALRFNRSRPAGGGRMPAIRLQRGKLRYCKVVGGNAEIVMSVPVEAQFGVGTAHEGYSFEIKTAKLSGGYGESYLNGYWRPGEFAVAGGLSSADMPSLERAWAIDVLAGQLTYERNGDYVLDLRLRELHGKQAPEVGALAMMSSGGVAGSGPLASLQKFFARYRPTGTVGSISLNAKGNLHRLRDSEVLGKLVCKDISICDAKFPYEIDHLTGDVDFTQSSILLNGLCGKHSSVDVRIEGWSKGAGVQRQYQYKVTSGNMILDEALYAALQPGQKRLWDAFQPSGVVAADYRLVRTSPTDKRMHISVDLNDVTASFHEFPYPLTNLTGKLYFDRDSVIATNLLSVSGGRQIRLNAKVTGREAGKPIHFISVDANDVPLDATLEKALPAKYRQLYQRLQADGTADARARVFSTGDANSIGPLSYVADIVCHSRSLKLEHVPVVLSDVVAEVAVSPEALTIKRLDGHYGSSPVAVTGGMRLADDRKARQYHARVTANDVPVDGTMIGLLSKSLADQLTAFRLQGNVNLALDLRTPDGNEPPTYTGDVECLGMQINHERFPYPLQDVRGTISLTNDSFVLKDVTASPVDPCGVQPSARIHVDGSASLAKGGLATGSFSLKAQGIAFTKELGEALPRTFTGVYRDLSPAGSFDVDVAKLEISRVSQDQTIVEFAGRADLRDCDLRISGAEIGLSGVVDAEGSYNTREGLSRGRAGLSARELVIKGKAISDATTNVVYDPNIHRWSADDFLGDCYGGKVLGGVQLGRADGGGLEYLLKAAMNRVDLQRFLQAGKPAVTVEQPYSGGVMNASFSLGGRFGDKSSRRGACRVDIEDMKVGRVSPLANLLSVLSLNEPTDYTFEQMLIDAYIKQDMLLIRKLDMSGRNVAFTGSGTMVLSDGDLNLLLTARGQRLAVAEPSVLQALTEGLGVAVVRMEVTGKASNPLVETKTLPVIEDSLRILGSPQ